MKEFAVTEIAKEIAIRGTFDVPQRLRPGTYVFAVNNRPVGEADASEAQVLSGIGNRILMVNGRNRDDDLDFVLAGMGSEVALSIYEREAPENRVTMMVSNVASVVKLLGTMLGEASPDQDLEGRLLISGVESTAIRCYEPKIWRGNPYLQIDPQAAAVPLINEALQAGQDVRIHLANGGSQ